ncbi:hypothetical protein D3C76_1421310 [compost metagenome]
MHHLVQRGVPGGRRPEGNRGNFADATIELRHRHAMTLGNFLQFFLHYVQVERRCQGENRIRIHLKRRRSQHLFLVLLQQIRCQAFLRGILLALGTDGVPTDLHR